MSLFLWLREVAVVDIDLRVAVAGSCKSRRWHRSSANTDFWDLIDVWRLKQRELWESFLSIFWGQMTGNFHICGRPD